MPKRSGFVPARGRIINGANRPLRLREGARALTFIFDGRRVRNGAEQPSCCHRRCRRHIVLDGWTDAWMAWSMAVKSHAHTHTRTHTRTDMRDVRAPASDAISSTLWAGVKNMLLKLHRCASYERARALRALALAAEQNVIKAIVSIVRLCGTRRHTRARTHARTHPINILQRLFK